MLNAGSQKVVQKPIILSRDKSFAVMMLFDCCFKSFGKGCLKF